MLHQNRAVALIIVLSMLVLLSAMIVAFMSTVSVDRTATQASVSGSISRQISDSTVNLVIGQIREATTQQEEATTWASQPGMIRTHAGRQMGRLPLPLGINGLEGGSAFYYDYSRDAKDYVYKLYSADRMRLPANEYNPGASSTNNLDGQTAENKVIEEWERTNPMDGYIDLNEPMLSKVTNSKGDKVTEPRYPIIDPRAKYRKDGSRNVTPAPGIVDGFDAKITEDSTLRLDGGAAVPYIPMPVRWLYVLRDGTIGPASLGNDANPIVGRTAFWTDDETCKLNINTASEGTFWDTPSMSSDQESGNIAGGNPPATGVLTSAAGSLSLAASQPVKGEYQRYSGHPSTTSLSPVLGWLWDVTPTTPISPNPNGPYYKFKEAIYQITPFLPSGSGTTQGATRNSKEDIKTARGFLNITTKHLYSSVDELVFKSIRNTATTLDPEPVLNNPLLTPDALERTRFFLTTNSRAPEVNLFGRPRVTIWPVNADPKLRTQFDDAFTFASTIYKSPYADSGETNDTRFMLFRNDAKDDRNDFDGSMIPKFKKTVSQNLRMYEYLQWLTGVDKDTRVTLPVPGFGGRLGNKYSFERKEKVKNPDGTETEFTSSERDQILTEMFDYMRAVNLVDTGVASQSITKLKPYTPLFYTTNPPLGLDYTRFARSVDWSGQVTPLKIKNTMGLGRFITISEAALVFYRSGPPISAAKPQSAMRAALLFEIATPMPGFPSLRETFFTKVRAVIPTEIGFTGGPGKRSVGFSPDWLININNVASHEIADGRAFMPIMGVAAPLYCYPEHPGLTGRSLAYTPQVKKFANNLLASKDGNYKRDPSGNPAATDPGTVCIYPYVSNEISLVKTAPDTLYGEMTLYGGSFEVEIWSGESPLHKDNEDRRARLVQTLTLDFSKYGAVTVRTPNGVNGQDISLPTRLDGTLTGSTISPANLIRAEDVVRSLELTGGMDVASQRGDIRIAAARHVVPASYYTASGGLPEGTGPYYTKPATGNPPIAATTAVVHSLAYGHGNPITGAVSGNLVAGGSPRGGKPYILPREVTGGVTRIPGGSGDWDRGLSKHMDGAFGNKVDEGNVRFAYNEGGAGRLPYYRGRAIDETGQSFFTPNRQLPSAVMFGSLPTGALAGRPWQTLLFRPDHESGNNTHPGAAVGSTAEGAPDHLFLDLFHIPVVEPFAISEPFSTMSKVNMNYVIAPFGYAKGGDGENPGTKNKRSYLRRDTALRGVLKSTFVTAVKTTTPNAAHAEVPLGLNEIFRFPINLDRTLETFESRLNPRLTPSVNIDPGQPLFRTASEICDIPLYPQGLSVTDWNRFWTVEYAQTGDNQRERPYAHIFPRLTTKSNVYTVHMRCQTIRKAPGSDANVFDEKKDTVVSEYRGQATIERFIDPNDQSLKTYDQYNEKIDPYYRYRVINVKQFAPH